ncbi:S2-RNase [Pyrus ussuriensis x Pyrus communis]|uniref:S2-RNase n=1 Tax=Pyrus ussuriensis x Pyrus communis TaxID=2448454 RepID=A0A5N5GSB8_9ROSA|nr:S2-RNase [Pyrus ussuriensis x Pyrus communis]
MGHKAHMNSLKVLTASKTSKNVKFEKVPHGGRNQLHWRSKKEYRILRRAQEDIVMIPTPRWSLEPICFGTISPERKMPSPLLVDTLCKQIMLAFFIVDITSTYGALLGRDWIHQSLSVPSTLHQQMVEAESQPFLPTANVAEASFYNYSIGIVQCLRVDKNGRPTKNKKERTKPEDLLEIPELVEFLCAELDKPSPKVQDPIETIDLGTQGDPRPIQISGMLEVEVRAKIVSLPHEFKNCFAWHYTKMLGLDSTLAEHRMLIKKGYKPVKQAPWRMSKEIEEQVKKGIKRLVKAGFIRPTKYVEWLANIVPVLKVITNAIQCCVDYRNINGATPKDEYPMPMVDLSIDAVAKHKVLSFMDGNAGCNQIKMTKEDIHKAAFRCPGHVGAYEYLVMSFGLKVFGTTYKRTMNAIFHDLISHSMEHQESQEEIINILGTFKVANVTSERTATGTTPYALTFEQDDVLPMEINYGKQCYLWELKLEALGSGVRLRRVLSLLTKY